MTQPEHNEYYCTKLAFGSGIFLARKIRDRIFKRSDLPPNSYTYFYAYENEVHKTWESAMEEVERMRAKKIASLEKQLSKVKAKQFKQP